MAPHSPPRSGQPGEPGPPLDLVQWLQAQRWFAGKARPLRYGIVQWLQAQRWFAGKARPLRYGIEESAI